MLNVFLGVGGKVALIASGPGGKTRRVVLDANVEGLRWSLILRVAMIWQDAKVYTS